MGPLRWFVRVVRVGAAILAVQGFDGVACAASQSATDRLAAAWARVHDYSVSIDAHEVLGSRTEDRQLRYAFEKPSQARLDLMSGDRRVASLVWSGGDQLVAYHPGLAFIRLRGNVHDRRFTSLRGNGVLTPNLGDIVACLEQRKQAIQEHPGPIIGGAQTQEIRLSYATGDRCPDDPAVDGAITRDVFDVALSGVVVMRKRYEGEKLVESWDLHDYRINAGLPDSALK